MAHIMKTTLSKKLMMILVLCIGIMPMQELFATPKQRNKSHSDSARVAQKARAQKEEEQRLERFTVGYTIIYYGAGAHNAAQQIRQFCKQSNNRHIKVVSFEGPDAKEKAIKLRDKLMALQKKYEIIGISVYIGMCVLVVVVIPIVINAVRRYQDHQAARNALQNDIARLIPLVQGAYNMGFPMVINLAWNDQVLFRDLVHNTDRGAALRNAVIQQARFYGTETQNHFQNARERIDNFRFFTMMRGMLADVSTRTLIQHFPDDVEVVGLHHLRNNVFHRIAQMPQAVRILLVDAMTTRHLQGLEALYQRARMNNYGFNVFHPPLPAREEVRQIMLQRMQQIMAMPAAH